MLRKLKKLWDWLPIIWKDEDWDYAFLLKLMKYKLSRMENVVGSRHSFAANWEQLKVELATAQLLISKVEADPDDEWNLYFNTHSKEDIDAPLYKEKQLALAFSRKREERNWKALWKYLEKNMQRWWD